MEDCIFCKIVRQEIPAKLAHEDEDCLAFHDIRPRARVHLLVISKKHLPSLREIQAEDEKLMGKLVYVTSQMAKKFQLNDYQLSVNTGAKAGQEVFHLHFHLKSVD